MQGPGKVIRKITEADNLDSFPGYLQNNEFISFYTIAIICSI